MKKLIFVWVLCYYLNAGTIYFSLITCNLILRKHFPASFLGRLCTTYDAFFCDKLIITMEIEVGVAGFF